MLSFSELELREKLLCLLCIPVGQREYVEAQIEGSETFLAEITCRPIVGVLDVSQLPHAYDVKDLFIREAFPQQEIFQHLQVFLILIPA